MQTTRHRSGLVVAHGFRAHGMLFLLMIMFPWSCAHAQERPRRILMLHAFNYTFPSTTIGGDAARKRLLERSPNKIEIGGEFLDLARFPGPDHEKRLVSFLREKYAASPPDVVMALGNLALQFIVKHRDSIAPAVPVVFAGIPPTAYSASRLPADVTGIITEFNLDKTLALAEALQPDARQVVMIGGSGLVDRQWQADARRTVESRGRKFETTYLFGLPYETLVAELARVPSNAIVIILTVFADSTGKSFVPAEVGAALAPLSPAPVYSPLSTFLGNGTVGGFIETFESVGVAAADLSLEIIAGKAPATIPPRANPGQAYRVDFRAMQRWNLREGDLPANTIVLFKDPTLWDEHRNLVIAAICIFVLQTAVAGSLLIQRRRRLRAEVLLKESEERMTFTAASVNLGLWQFDRETNELWATGHSRALFGLGDDVPLTNEAFLTAIHPEDRETAIASLSKATTSEGQSAVTDVRVAREGEQRWIRIRARSQPDDKGAPTQVSGIFVDITEQKIAEIESALQRQEVAHLMRVSVLGELSGAIAHEINQPLTAIQSNAETGLDLLAVDPPDLSEIREVFQDIVDDNRRASEVIQRLRNLLKKGETTPVSVDVNGLVTSTLALLNNELISRRISVKLDLASGLPATIGDPVQLQQVLLNLVMNAMDAMASTQIAQRLITVSTFNTRAGVIEAWVKDSGPGIQPAEESRVFEPFYTTKPSGLGLGLAICSTIIEAHGGDIELSNDNSGGAVAKISLPVRSMPIAAK